ncbi:MAG: lysophospholipid acyltransferase family protein [Verrucomicrobia bacterium]|nr:lysophospholipid acyltransferase family protein [Verrucomicrobiota bacterium]
MKEPDALQAPAQGAPDVVGDIDVPVIKKFSIYGDFWTRIQAVAVRQCPFFIEPILLAFYTVFFFILCPGTRKPVIDNLSVLFPESSRFINTLRAFRVFWSFANSITDAAHCREGANIIDWEIEGDEHFQEFISSNNGAIVLTAHMGNYDVAAPMFASKFGKKLNAVRAPERDLMRQRYMQEKFSAEASDDYEVRYNADDKFLGIDLARSLMNGEYVAIQGDRVLFDVSPLKVPVKALPGMHMNIPKGPFVLALTSKVAILPLFAVRLGRRRYRIVVLPEFRCERSSRDYEQAIEAAASQWVDSLLPVIRQYWFQWYVFELAFFKDLAVSPQ